MYAITNAPEAYDYNYVSTVAYLTDKQDREWRFIHATDADRFKAYQTPRYQSGMYQAFPFDTFNESVEVLSRFDEPTWRGTIMLRTKHVEALEYQARIEALTFEDKLALYRAGSYKFSPPDVAGTWSEKGWIRHIDRAGRWIL